MCLYRLHHRTHLIYHPHPSSSPFTHDHHLSFAPRHRRSQLVQRSSLFAIIVIADRSSSLSPSSLARGPPSPSSSLTRTLISATYDDARPYCAVAYDVARRGADVDDDNRRHVVTISVDHVDARIGNVDMKRRRDKQTRRQANTYNTDRHRHQPANEYNIDTIVMVR